MIRTAIVGLGWWGKTLVESAQDNKLIRFTAATTRSRSKAHQEFSNQHGIDLRDDYSNLIEDPDIDAIFLATPPALHRNEIIAAAEAGKHILCEKPFTMNAKEAMEAIEATRKAGVVLGIGYNRRFHPSWIDLRNRILGGELGQILHMEATMTGPNGLMLPPEAWRAQRDQAPCGGLFPMAVHAIDGMINLGGEFQEAYAYSRRAVVPNEVDDTTSMLLQMKDGTSCSITTIMATAGNFGFRVFGSKGWAYLGGQTHVAGQSSEERRSRLFGSYIFQPLKGDALSLDVPEFDVNRAELEAFANACSGGPDYPISLEDTLHCVSTTDAVIKSANSGKPEYVV